MKKALSRSAFLFVALAFVFAFASCVACSIAAENEKSRRLKAGSHASVLLIDSSERSNSDAQKKLVQDLAKFRVTVKSQRLIDQKQFLEKIGAIAKTVPTNSTLFVCYRGPILLGEEKQGSKYTPAAFMASPNIKVKNSREIRSRAVSFQKLLSIFANDSGANRVVLFREQTAAKGELAKYAMLEDVGLLKSHREQKDWNGLQLFLPSVERPYEKLRDYIEPIASALEKTIDAENALAKKDNLKAGAQLVNSVGQIFCYCPPGKFQMGSPSSEPNRSYDEDQVETIISLGFWISKFEVTEREYFAVTKRRLRKPVGKNFPYTDARHGDAKRYAEMLTKLARSKGEIDSNWIYEIPTEAEWEYACRAGTMSAFCFDESQYKLSEFANFADRTLFEFNASDFRYADRNLVDGFAKAAPVGSYRANNWGIHDMHGNVWEWTRDVYSQQRPGGKDPLVSQKQFDDRGKVIRGGSWLSHSHYCRSAMRNAQFDLNSAPHIGIRIVLKKVKK